MRSPCSPDRGPGAIANLNVIECGLPARHGRRPSSRVQAEFGPWWLAAIATGAILTSSGVAAQDAELIEEGRRLFMEETFDGNGRTCATCHPPANNFTVDPAWIRTLKGNDPLFLVGPGTPDLKEIEIRNLLRNNALFLENVDGLDQPGVLRSAPHTLALQTSLMPDDNVLNRGITHATGWSGDGAPDDGSIKSFAKGAVIQHFTKSANRVAGVDFRLPTDEELEAMEAFQLSLGRQANVDITSLSFTDDFVNQGRDLFIEAPARDGTRGCNGCHNNAGATTADGVNRNFATGTNRHPNAPACLAGFVAPYDGGLGTTPAVSVARAEICDKGPKGGPKAFAMYQGDMTMNTPPLVEAADTGPYFHNNIVAKLEDAVAFYTSDVFASSLHGNNNPFVLSRTQINQIGAFLRALNVLENIRSSNAYAQRAIDPAELAPRKLMAELALAETTDAIEVLKEAPVQLFPAALNLLSEAQKLERQALKQNPPAAGPLQDAIELKLEARDEILE